MFFRVAAWHDDFTEPPDRSVPPHAGLCRERRRGNRASPAR